MDYNKRDMKFIKTSDEETARKLRYLGFPELTESNSNTFCFINDGRKLIFDVEKYDAIYTNILCL